MASSGITGISSSFQSIVGVKAMILAAGVGSRLKPWTNLHPKALAIVNGKSLLQRNIEYLQQFGINEVVVNVHHFAEQVIAAIEKNNGWGSNIAISDEKDELLETGGGLLKAARLLQGVKRIVVMNVDMLTDLDISAMLSFHRQEKPLATIATTSRETSRYFLFTEEDNLCGWKNIQTGEEKPKNALPHALKTQKAFSGIHVLEQKIFSLIKHKGKFSMVDVYLDLMKDHVIKSFDHSDGRLIDVGKPESIGKAEAIFTT